MLREGHCSDPNGPPEEVVDRAAALDDLLGGFGDGALPSGAAMNPSDAPAVARALDTAVLLRQAAAADGVGQPPPERIGRYQIIRLAGYGGFANVWEAFDPVLKRRVALKVRRADVAATHDSRRRFLREAALASRLAHPNIVTIYEVGVDADREFITAEFCDGGSFADWLKQNPGPMPPRQAVGLVEVVARAVAHAHAAGVIHRDIKPANILLAPVRAGDAGPVLLPEFDSREHAKTDDAAAPRSHGLTLVLCDFGLGTVNLDTTTDTVSQLTVEGARLGTPAWMAPEQIDRSFGPVGPATDIHAIGLLLDRLLTGRCMQNLGTDVEAYRQILLTDPVPVDRLIAGIPRDLVAVCLKCLEKRPVDRYQSATDLADDLARWLDGRATRARPLSPGSRLVNGIARRPIIAGLAGLVLVAAMVAGWSHLQRVDRESAIRRQDAAAELRRAFDGLRAGNVVGAFDHLGKSRQLDPELADSLAGRWLRRRAEGSSIRLFDETPIGSGITTGLHAIAVAADGAVAFGGAVGRLHVLPEPGSGGGCLSIRAHDEINDVCFSPDGSLVATAGQDGRVCWWSAGPRSLTLVGESASTGCPLFAVAFSADGRSLIHGGADRLLRRIRLDAPGDVEILHRFEGAADRNPDIEAISVFDDAIVVAYGMDLAVCDRNGQSQRLLERPAQKKAGKPDTVLYALAVSPDRRSLAAGGSDQLLHVWDLAEGRIRNPLGSQIPGFPGWVQACRYSANGSMLAAACRDGCIRVFDAPSGRLVKKHVGHRGRVWDIEFGADGSLLSAGADGTLRRWNSGSATTDLGLRDIPVDDAAIHLACDATWLENPLHQQLVIVGSDPRTPRLLDLVSGSATAIPGSPLGTETASIAVDRRRGLLACGYSRESDRGPTVRPLWQTPPGSAIPASGWDLATPGSTVCFTPEGNLVVGDDELPACIWQPDFSSSQEIGGPESEWRRMVASPMSPDRIAHYGKTGAIVSLDRAGRRRGRPLELEPFERHVSAIAWSPDSERLACGQTTGEMHILDAGSGRRIGRLAPHEREVVGIAYSADGRALVTADSESLRISDVATLTLLDEIRPGWTIHSICLVADGAAIAIAGEAAVGSPSPRGRLSLMDLRQSSR